MFFVLFLILLVTISLYLLKVYTKFSRNGIKHFTPIPVLGNIGSLVFATQHLSEQLDDLYFAFPEERFVGRYEIMNPVLFIRDLELVKKITVQNYEQFINHRDFTNEEIDPLFGRNLLCLKDQQWKEMRSTLSPAFTSSKMRLMVPAMLDAVEMLIHSLKTKINESEDHYVDVDVTDITSRLSNDVISACAFGYKVNSHKDVNNTLYTTAKECVKFGLRRFLVMFGVAACPMLFKKLNFKIITDDTSEVYRKIINKNMQDRADNKIVRMDMLQLLMDVKSDWSSDDLVAQALLFYLAGFETVSTAMSFLLHELALNPDVQERLAQEIRAHDLENKGEVDLTSIQTLTYLNMVVSEVLRKWPPAIGIDRVCNQDLNIGKANSKSENDYIIRKGDVVMISSWSLHHDPQYYPNPLKFDPERFSEENKHKIKQSTYAPFGLGPRNCIGSRFAICEMKVTTYKLLKHLIISTCKKTPLSPKLVKGDFSLKLQGGQWVRFKIRD